MSGHENCGHTEVQEVILRLTEEIVEAGMMALVPMVELGLIEGGSAGIQTATVIFASALETGIRAALIDPIGAQLILDHLDETSMVSGVDLEEANLIMAQDARHLLEAAARL